MIHDTIHYTKELEKNTKNLTTVVSENKMMKFLVKIDSYDAEEADTDL